MKGLRKVEFEEVPVAGDNTVGKGGVDEVISREITLLLLHFPSSILFLLLTVMTDNKSSFHPALAVSNIRNHISITLELENVQYSTWAKLFKITTSSHKVLHHIIPPDNGNEKVPVTEDEKELWLTLDATVLSWLYATISNDLLHTIIELDAKAIDAWNRLRDIFQDNKHSRAVTLEAEFSNTKMENFSNASAYCQRLKSLADQLKNVGAPVSESCLVIQLVSGLTSAYRGFGTLIRQSDPLPQFYQARSMLTLEEAILAKEAATGSESAMLHHQQHRGKPSGYRKNSGKKSGAGGRGFDGGKSGRAGDGSGSPQQSGGSPQQQPQWGSSPWPNYPSWGWMPQWAPPCPYPNQG
ncbi:uncharacterized protein LOC113862194 [Abrus precatorius]|uniref:Uncharacterized protein LOC113862194 n=1 Tax=Abrus precatorius TaxID=3816 RepID=A0A8B8L4J0_ABRPR|nr:uncharacterized protein LOC113862194 [Abrus precatorius]